MARPVRVTLLTTGVTRPIPLNNYADPFNAGIGVKLNDVSTGTYTVEHTFDNVFDPAFDASTATWYTSTFGGNTSAKTANADGNYAFPVVATRLNVTVLSGSITITVIQAGY
jgi:hypothetical protein